MGTDEFRPITRKKWISRKRVLRYSGCEDDSHDNFDVAKFMRRLERARNQMAESDYFLQSMEKVNLCLAEQPHIERLERIVCLGLGEFALNYIAFHQLAFILCAQDYYNIQTASYYDPAFHTSEKEVLKKLGIELITEDQHGKHAVEAPTLYYLPHCGNSLTNNLLWCNWTREQLRQMVVINNSFEHLTTGRSLGDTCRDSTYILESKDFVQELPLEDDYEVKNVFNDLSVHVFPESKMQPASAAFWAPRPAPTYPSTNQTGTLEIQQRLGQLQLHKS